MLALTLLASLGLAACSTAQADDNISWSVDMVGPGMQVSVSNGYYRSGMPMVVEVARPVYVRPAPVYVEPEPVYVPAPPVAYVPAPRVISVPVPMYRPEPHYREHHHHGRGHGHARGHWRESGWDGHYENRFRREEFRHHGGGERLAYNHSQPRMAAPPVFLGNPRPATPRAEVPMGRSRPAAPRGEVHLGRH